jgi:death-on-curing protein
VADALSAHDRALRVGGLEGVRDLTVVQSAIARPYNGYYRPIEKKAAALVQSIAGNHGFVDGNKRTALILLHTLLTKSGYELSPAEPSEVVEDAAEEMVLAIVLRAMTFDQCVAWFRRRIRRIQLLSEAKKK